MIRITHTPLAIARANLLQLIKTTHEAEEFNMGHYSYCGTPACILGNYAARTDWPHPFALRTDGTSPYGWISLKTDTLHLMWDDEHILGHFGLVTVEADSIFSHWGCDNAGTNKEKAIRYLRKFVGQKFSNWDTLS